jgi:hypothetical protein
LFDRHWFFAYGPGRYSAEKTRYEPGTSGVMNTVVEPSGVPVSTCPVSMSVDRRIVHGVLFERELRWGDATFRLSP